ncbi:hypothetical protein BDV06DRAFT_191771 [Aspergillus oleicola]
MTWSTETVIALITLTATGPPSILLLWTYFRRRWQAPRLGDLNNTDQLTPTTRPRARTWSHFDRSDILMELSPYSHRVRTDIHEI